MLFVVLFIWLKYVAFSHNSPQRLLKLSLQYKPRNEQSDSFKYRLDIRISIIFRSNELDSLRTEVLFDVDEFQPSAAIVKEFLYVYIFSFSITHFSPVELQEKVLTAISTEAVIHRRSSNWVFFFYRTFPVDVSVSITPFYIASQSPKASDIN